MPTAVVYELESSWLWTPKEGCLDSIDANEPYDLHNVHSALDDNSTNIAIRTPWVSLISLGAHELLLLQVRRTTSSPVEHGKIDPRRKGGSKG